MIEPTLLTSPAVGSPEPSSNSTISQFNYYIHANIHTCLHPYLLAICLYQFANFTREKWILGWRFPQGANSKALIHHFWSVAYSYTACIMHKNAGSGGDWKPRLCLCSLPNCLAQTRVARSPRNTLCLFPREAAFSLIFTKTLYRLAQVPLARSLFLQLVLVQSLSHVWLFVTPWTAACQASLSITNSWSLLKLRSIESVMPSIYLILCHPLRLPPSIFPSIRVFSNESVLPMRWPKYWSFSFSISPSHEYSGLISFRMDWLDLPSVQGTLRSLLQHHSSKASILRCSAFFIVQLSHPYMTTGKTVALIRQTLMAK